MTQSVEMNNDEATMAMPTKEKLSPAPDIELRDARPLFDRLSVRIRRAITAGFPEWRMRRRVGKAYNLRGITYPGRSLLFECAKQSATGAGAIEIGSYLGASTACLAAGMQEAGKGGTIECIDTWENDTMSEGKWDTYAKFRENIEPWSDFIVPVRARSETADIEERPRDLVFVDGDHSYAGVTTDVSRYAPLVRDGGLLVLDDHGIFPGVSQALGELLATGGWYIDRCTQNVIALRRDNTPLEGRRKIQWRDAL